METTTNQDEVKGFVLLVKKSVLNLIESHRIDSDSGSR